MELFNNTSRVRLMSIVDNYANAIIEDRGTSNVEDLVSAFSEAGFTKSEFFQILDRYYLSSYKWAEETETDWSKETEADKKVNVGDTDRAVLETALTQIGVPYSWEESTDGDRTGWIDLKILDDGVVTENTAAEIYFDKDGKFNALY